VPKVAQVVAVVGAAQQPRNTPLAQAVTAGRVPVRRAARLVRALERVAPFVTEQEYRGYQQIGLPLAACGTDKDLALGCAHLVAVVSPEWDGEDLAGAQRAARDLLRAAVDGGMVEFTWRLDPEGAAVVHAVTHSAAPAPCPDHAGPDPRSPGTRRAEALLTVLKRGMAAGDGVHTNGAATMMVRFDHGVLAGQVTSIGRTATGEQLSAGVRRRLACEAGLVPAVYGGPSRSTANAPCGSTRRIAGTSRRSWNR